MEHHQRLPRRFVMQSTLSHSLVHILLVHRLLQHPFQPRRKVIATTRTGVLDVSNVNPEISCTLDDKLRETRELLTVTFAGLYSLFGYQFARVSGDMVTISLLVLNGVPGREGSFFFEGFNLLVELAVVHYNRKTGLLCLCNDRKKDGHRSDRAVRQKYKTGPSRL